MCLLFLASFSHRFWCGVSEWATERQQNGLWTQSVSVNLSLYHCIAGDIDAPRNIEMRWDNHEMFIHIAESVLHLLAREGTAAAVLAISLLFLCVSTSVCSLSLDFTAWDGEDDQGQHCQWLYHVLPPGCTCQRHQRVSGCYAGENEIKIIFTQANNTIITQAKVPN